MREIIKKYSLAKLQWIIAGGSSGHDCIRNSVFFLNCKISQEDYVIILDAVRSVFSQKAFDEIIRVAYEQGNPSPSVVYHLPIVYADDFELIVFIVKIREKENGYELLGIFRGFLD